LMPAYSSGPIGRGGRLRAGSGALSSHMPGRCRLAASAAVGSLMLLGTPGISSAQRTAASLAQPVGRLAAFFTGAIHGVVRDETGSPVAGATVSVVGPTTSVAVTDRDGRFELRTLAPGPVLVHATLSGHVAPP